MEERVKKIKGELVKGRYRQEEERRHERSRERVRERAREYKGARKSENVRKWKR